MLGLCRGSPCCHVCCITPIIIVFAESQRQGGHCSVAFLRCFFRGLSHFLLRSVMRYFPRPSWSPGRFSGNVQEQQFAPSALLVDLGYGAFNLHFAQPATVSSTDFLILSFLFFRFVAPERDVQRSGMFEGRADGLMSGSNLSECVRDRARRQEAKKATKPLFFVSLKVFPRRPSHITVNVARKDLEDAGTGGAEKTSSLSRC